jgi:hypothetical protein
MSNPKRAVPVLLLAALVAHGVPGVEARDDDALVLMVEPAFPPEQARAVYGPMVELLSARSGTRIEISAPRSYPAFWTALRNEAPPDMLLSEAAFAAFMMRHEKMKPVVTLGEPVVYNLLVGSGIAQPTLASLIGKRVVAAPSPSVAMALVYDLYRDPIRQPEIIAFNTSQNDAAYMLYTGDIDAVMVTATVAQEFSTVQSVYTSPAFPAVTVSMSNDLAAPQREAIIGALLAMPDDEDGGTILLDLGFAKAGRADPEAFVGQDRVLAEMYGYR